MPIKILPPEVASQIAAGEVVERPSSVVKELIENSLDAGASHIVITIAGAGKDLIEVSDDGSGIPETELPLAVERHATSKLSSAADLFQITTLGFRGEALSSIGSVSRMSITTRQTGSQAGTILKIDGGVISRPKAIGAPTGTSVRVQNLFYNIPARLKFLKSDRTERSRIDEVVTLYAIAYPEVRFELTQDERDVLKTSGKGGRLEILASMYGVDIARQMLEIRSNHDHLQIRGFISPTTITRTNRKAITFFVNGRPVQDAALVAALLKGYHTLLMVGRYPIGIIFIDISPEMVDVNVHPAKAEVRFRDREDVFVSVQNVIRGVLLAHTPVPGLGPQLRWSPTSSNSGVDVSWTVAGDKGFSGQENIPQGSQQSEGVGGMATQSALPSSRVPLLRLIGQIASAYLVAEGPDGLYLIDQHAAHERILFERYLSQSQEKIPSQTLLEPAVVELPPAGFRQLDEQIPLLEKLGFKLEPFGPSTMLVRAIPALLGNLDPASALRVLVEDFEEDETPLQEEIESMIIARVCKRAAVKAGQVLSPEEQSELLSNLEACRSPRTCPHGRPTMIHISVDLLEKQFGRKGAR